LVRSCRDIPGQHLFQYRDADGKPRKVGSLEVNEYLREVAGGTYTAKDFRTWSGTVGALERVAALPEPETQVDAEMALVGVIEGVAAELGNTPAVCRKSYIHPRVLEAYVEGSLPVRRRRAGLSADEGGVLKLLVG
jgi:DNA topoisomerase I